MDVGRVTFFGIRVVREIIQDEGIVFVQRTTEKRRASSSLGWRKRSWTLIPSGPGADGCQLDLAFITSSNVTGWKISHSSQGSSSGEAEISNTVA